ncbi:hypothetical protein Q8F55_006487 [Vanrija albida]|uniref:ABC transporter domain-containing protein n=1 Tax=Vanrija albida TaxID=181172 RepID=A0ABR3PXA7_9TREE
MSPPLLEASGLTLRRDDGTGSAILSASATPCHLDLTVEPGEVVIIQGESGSGKTTLLKCIAELNVYQEGEIRLNGQPSASYGIPNFRTLVQYIPQRPSMLPGTPVDFLERCRSFAARQARDAALEAEGRSWPDPYDLADGWGIERTCWTRGWGTLSGGEAQRVALAIAIGLGGAEVILLDEPTSALDEATTKLVENTLVGMLPQAPIGAPKGANIPRRATGPKALVWITHSPEQADRVGTRKVDITRR